MHASCRTWSSCRCSGTHKAWFHLGKWGGKSRPRPGRSKTADRTPISAHSFAGMCLSAQPAKSPQLHPLTNAFRKHWKSLALRMGATLEPSQLAYGSFELNLLRKHWKSLALRMGAIVEPSQLA